MKQELLKEPVTEVQDNTLHKTNAVDEVNDIKMEAIREGIAQSYEPVDRYGRG